MKTLLTLIFTTIFSLSLFSTEIKYSSKNNFDIRILASNITWQKLLYMKDKKSEVLTSDYFLSGKKDVTSVEELISTINSYEEYDLKDFNNSAICRFPARYFWLSKYIDFPNYKIIDERCTNLSKWAITKNTRSISVMLVSGYLGNPASTFGHSFLKLNSKNTTENNDLFDLSINYGALVPENESTVSYIFNGITGGYEAGFSDKYFYTQDLVYSHTEFRDIWDYELDLSDEKKQLLLLHLWEIIGKKFKYYFLDKNCGYRVSQLLELVLEEILLENSKVWYVPVETFHALEEINKRKKILKSIKYIPSKQKEILQRFKTLSNNEKKISKSIVNNDFKNLDNSLLKSTLDEKINILNFLLEYYKYLIIKNEDNKKLEIIKNKLLYQRLLLPIKKVKNLEIEKLISPAKGNKPMTLGFGVGNLPDKNFYPKINFTAFSIESVGQNNLKFDELIVMDSSVGFKPNTGKIFLDKFDLIKIKKLKTSQNDFQDENLISWKINIGTRLIERDKENIYNTFFKGSIGKAYQVNNYITSSLMIDTNIQTIFPHIEAMGNIGLDFDFGRLKNSSIVGLKINPYNSSKDEFIKITTQYKISDNFSISNNIEKDINKKYTLDFKWFF